MSAARQGWVLLLACAAAYATLPLAGWVWDDDSYVTMNPVLRDATPLRAWVPGETPQYYPVLFTAFWAEFRIFGTEPLGWHVVNWIAHAAATLLLWRVLLRIRVPSAFAVSLLWAVHPMCTESVAWVTEGKNTLSMLAMCASALVWFRGRDAAQLRGSQCIGAGAWAGSAALFLVAMGCKTTSVALPVMVLAGEWWRGWRPLQDRRVIAAILPFLLVGIPMGLFTAHVESTQVGAFGPEFAHGALPRIVIACRALLFYPMVALWPVELSFIYPRWPTAPLDALGAASVAAAIAVIAAAAARARRGAPGMLLCALCYGAAIFPALGFINVWPHRYSFVADHFAYVALVPLIVAGVALARAAISRAGASAPRLASAALAAAATGFAALSAARTLDYRSEETLWRATIGTNPSGWMPRDNLAALLLAQARDAAAAGNAEAVAALAAEALEHDSVAAEDPGADFTVLSNMSEALRLLGRLGDARIAIDAAIAKAPRHADLHWQRGRLLELSGDAAGASASYGDAIALPGSTMDMAYDRVRALARSGKPVDAARELDALAARGATMAPGEAEAHAEAVAALAALIGRETRQPPASRPADRASPMPDPPEAAPSAPGSPVPPR